MAKKTPRKIVALSAAAIAAAYFGGRTITDPAYLAADTPTQLAAAVAASTTAGSASPLASGAPTQKETATPPATATPAAATTSGYKDGVYTGTGNSRRGTVNVSVTIAGGKITAVTLTGGTIQYPLSRIAALPAQVVARQSVQVDRVTGATYSVQAFQAAVRQALGKASSAV